MKTNFKVTDFVRKSEKSLKIEGKIPQFLNSDILQIFNF